MEKFSPNFSGLHFFHGCRIGNRKVDRAIASSFSPPYEGDLKPDYDIIGSYDTPEEYRILPNK